VTSEVLLMNLEAVVMGADSAVTISDGEAYRVSQSGVEKIFVIDDSGPIAAMIYGGGDFGGLPWKTVFGQFKLQHKPDIGSVKAYAKAMIAGLSDISGLGLTPHANAEQQSFSAYIRGFLLDYAAGMVKLGWEFARPVHADIATRALSALREDILFEAVDPITATDHTGKTRDPLPRRRIEAGQALTDYIYAHIGTTLSEEMGRIFEGAQYPESLVREVLKLAAESLLLEWLPEHTYGYTTGLVIAGFGAADALPAMVSMEFIGAFGGTLKYRILRSDSPSAASEPVIVETYAQDDLTRAFLTGAMPEYEHHALHATEDILLAVIKEIGGSIGQSNRKLSDELVKTLRPIAQMAPHAGLHVARMERWHRVSSKLGPLLDSANAGILADYAQKFMELPVIEHELMREASVARPISILSMERGRYQTYRDGAKT
jgi:hypothetical protein